MSTRERIDLQRRRLNKASAVLMCAVSAVECGIDAEILGDAMSVARELIDAADDALDSIELNRGAEVGHVMAARSINQLRAFMGAMRGLRQVELADARHAFGLSNRARSLGRDLATVDWFVQRVREHVLVLLGPRGLGALRNHGRIAR